MTTRGAPTSSSRSSRSGRAPACAWSRPGFAQLADDDHRTEFDAHTEGWTAELGELVAYLDAA